LMNNVLLGKFKVNGCFKSAWVWRFGLTLFSTGDPLMDKQQQTKGESATNSRPFFCFWDQCSRREWSTLPELNTHIQDDHIGSRKVSTRTISNPANSCINSTFKSPPINVFGINALGILSHSTNGTKCVTISVRIRAKNLFSVITKVKKQL
jgi:hypothetical protein